MAHHFFTTYSHGYILDFVIAKSGITLKGPSVSSLFSRIESVSLAGKMGFPPSFLTPSVFPQMYKMYRG